MKNNLEAEIAKSSLVDDSKIGQGTKVGPFANLYGCELGQNCKVGSYVEIQRDVKVGNDVTISSHSFLCSLVEVEDDVFIGHGVMTINDRFPPSKKRTGTDKHWEPTLIKEGAVIGSNTTLFPVTIGKYAIVAAGSVVTKDVSPYTVVAGNPAREISRREDLKFPDGSQAYE
jgi:UDP-2-acetamido-3-amino-2,3-dideoxy-glucuronate N-acetyltransferase